MIRLIAPPLSLSLSFRWLASIVVHESPPELGLQERPEASANQVRGLPLLSGERGEQLHHAL